MDNGLQPPQGTGDKTNTFAMWVFVGSMVFAALIIVYMVIFQK